MARKTRITAKPVEDVTAPSIVIVIDGVEYRLCFTFKALSAAKAQLLKVGNHVRLLQGLMFPSTIDVDTVPSLFYASLVNHHPELEPADVAKLITIENFSDITIAVLAAYEASRAPAKKAPRVKSGNVQAAQ